MLCRDPSEESPSSREDFYSGIVAEPPKTMNKSRYLVFFDDGYASYIPHHEIRLEARYPLSFPICTATNCSYL